MEDEGKVLVEGKAIVNSLSNSYNCNLEKAKNLEVVVGQFCGLKGVFKKVQLVAPGAYLGSKWGSTLRYPIGEHMIDNFVHGTMLHLFAFKEKMVKDAESLKQTLLQDNSLFGSQEVLEDQYFRKEIYYLSRKMQKFPKLNDDLFERPSSTV
ncbi:unnamed protein product [Mucor hiemalis]